jgi:serine/threonine-protein kinase
LKAGTSLEEIVFDPETTSKIVSGTLQPGSGKVFIAKLAKEQLMDLNLKANPEAFFSVYSPLGKVFLEDSKKRSLLIKLPEDGFYEFVVISNASEPVSYQLSITAENPTPTPTETITPEPTPTPSPTETTTPEPTPTPSPTETSTSEDTSTFRDLPKIRVADDTVWDTK